MEQIVARAAQNWEGINQICQERGMPSILPETIVTQGVI